MAVYTKLTKENTKIDWKKPLVHIDGLIRGLNTYPGAWTEIQNGPELLNVKIFKASYQSIEHDLNEGSVFDEDKKIKISHSEGILLVEEIQLPNKKRMDSQALLNGFSFKTAAKVL